jgi:hypothetical protein
MAEHPAPDASKLFEQWLEWENGAIGPGDLVKNLKRGGMREFLEDAAARASADTASA